MEEEQRLSNNFPMEYWTLNGKTARTAGGREREREREEKEGKFPTKDFLSLFAAATMDSFSPEGKENRGVPSFLRLRPPSPASNVASSPRWFSFPRGVYCAERGRRGREGRENCLLFFLWKVSLMAATMKAEQSGAGERYKKCGGGEKRDSEGITQR